MEQFRMPNTKTSNGSSAPAELDSIADRLLKAGEVAEILNVSQAKAYAMMKTRLIPVVKMGGSVRVPYRALMAWIEKNAELAYDS